MARRTVRRRARKILGAEPVALVWCELAGPIPAPPRQVHRAAGAGRLKPRHPWLLYAGAVVFFFVVVPMILIDKLGERTNRPPFSRRGGRGRGPSSGGAAPGTGGTGRHHGREGGGEAAAGVFDGDWERTAGRLLLRWYGHSPSRKRLVLVTGERICVAASPRPRLSPTRAGDFRTVAEFSLAEARIEAEAGGPRGFRTFVLRFADGSWLELGRLTDPDDADHFLRTLSTRP